MKTNLCALPSQGKAHPLNASFLARSVIRHSTNAFAVRTIPLLIALALAAPLGAEVVFLQSTGLVSTWGQWTQTVDNVVVGGDAWYESTNSVTAALQGSWTSSSGNGSVESILIPKRGVES